MKLYKKIGLLSISLLVSLSLSTKVQAEEEKVCKDVEYTNYYFLSGIYTEDNLNTIISDGKKQYHGTFFPALPDNKKNSVEKKVCLSEDEEDTLCIKEEFDLDDFYTKYKAILKSGEEKNFKIKYKDKNGKEQESTSKTIKLTEGTATYFLHDKWYVTDENKNIVSDTSSKIQRYNTIDNAELIKGALIPKTTSIEPLTAGTDAIMLNVGREIVSENKTGKPGIDMPDYYEAGKTYLSPALYKITYEVEECTSKEPEKPEEKKYTATIKYLYKDTDKEASKPYSEKNLDDGYTKEVDSPKVENCTPDKEKVTVKVEGKNFEEVVYYTCKAEDVKETPKTGNILIFIAWTVGLGALGYSVYWFKKNKQEEV